MDAGEPPGAFETTTPALVAASRSKCGPGRPVCTKSFREGASAKNAAVEASALPQRDDDLDALQRRLALWRQQLLGVDLNLGPLPQLHDGRVGVERIVPIIKDRDADHSLVIPSTAATSSGVNRHVPACTFAST